MKKLFLSILATAMVALGLVATVEAPAQAACPYSACIDTKTKANHKKQITGSSITVKVKVKPASGSGTPQGTVKVSVKKYNGTYLEVQTLPYSGGKVSFTFKGLSKKGKYRVIAKFQPGASSVYKASKVKQTFIKK